MRGLKMAALALVVLVIAGLLLAVWQVRRAWPREEATVQVAGLRAPVEVVRDEWGVPHLFADGVADLFFAQGYVHAQDRLWQMELNRSAGGGRLGALFGPPAVEADRYLRTLGLGRAAARDLELLSGEARQILEAYARGVNAFLEENRGRLPVEFTLLGVDPQPWTPLDSLAWSRAMSLNLSLNGPLEMLRVRLAQELGEEAVDRLLPPYPADGPVIVPPEAGGYGSGNDTGAGLPPELAALFPGLASPARAGGSNAWVVHGSRTATGKPLLANDTHLGLSLPSIWYENGLHGGGFDVVGYSLPGLPLVVIGQNRAIAWGVTNLNADVQDHYLEEVDDPESPTRYRFGDGWEEVETVVETIPAKGGEAVEHPVYLTRHGPLLHQVLPEPPLARPFALAWAAMDGSRLLDALVRLDRAGDWAAFRDALSRWDTPSLNFVYADVDGHIGYQATGKIPLRAPGHDGTRPVPGWTGEHEWQGFIPFAELPHALDPPAGFFVTANHKVVDDDYRYVLTADWPPPDRARRIGELLAAAERVSLRDMRNVQADTYSLPAEVLRPALVAAADPRGEQEERALELVRSWDLRYDADSAGASVYHAWVYFLVRETLADELSEALEREYLPLVLGPSPFLLELMERPQDAFFDDRETPEREGRDEVVQESFRRAVEYLAERGGDDPGEWRWGRLHRMIFRHQPLGQSGVAPLEWLFNARPVAAAGSSSTVNALAGMPDDPLAPVFGVSQRYLADLADLSRSLAANSTGQSGLAFHRHRDDQVPLWRDVELHPVFTDRPSLADRETRLLRLVPR